MNVLLFGIFALVVFSSGIHAQCPVTSADVSEQQYSNIECYNNKEFYQKTDPNKWNWNNVKWEHVDFNDKRIYAAPQLYSNLPKEQYSKIRYDLANLQQLKQENIDIRKFGQDVAPGRAFNFESQSKLNCNNCKLTFRKNADNSYAIKSDSGSEVYITDYPKGTLFTLNKDGSISLNYLKETRSIETTKRGTFTIDSGKTELILSDGTKFSEKLSFQDGKAYVKGGDIGIVNGVRIESNPYGRYKYDIAVNLNGEPCNSKIDCITFNRNDKDVKFQSRQERMDVTFLSNNEFVKVEPRDLKTRMSLRYHDIAIKNRDDQGLIPLVTVIQPKSGSYLTSIVTNMLGVEYSERLGVDYGSWARIRTGAIDLNMINGKMKSSTNFESRWGSSPMTIHYQDNQANNLLGTKEQPQKIIISNFNELYTIPASRQEAVIQNYDRTPAKVSELLSFNYNPEFTLEYFKKKYPNIEIIGEEGDIKKLTELFERLPKDTVESLQSLTIDDDLKDKFCSEGTGGVGARACVDIKDRSLYIGKNAQEYTFIHESTHVLTAKLKQESDQKLSELKFQEYQKLRSEILEIAKRNNIDVKEVTVNDYDVDWKTTSGVKITSLPKSDYDYISQKQKDISNIKVPYFTEEWKSIAGDTYHGDYQRWVLVNRYPEKFGLVGPSNGVTRPYGFINEWEDIAAYTENIYRNSDFYNPLIAPSNPDKRYIQKLALMNKYDQFGKTISFLPEGWLAQRMKEAGYSQECIQAVNKPGGQKATCINKK